MGTHYYQVLDSAVTAQGPRREGPAPREGLDDERVRAARNAAAVLVHRDKNGERDEELTRAAFVLVTQAFEALRDEGARARYARARGLR